MAFIVTRQRKYGTAYIVYYEAPPDAAHETRQRCKTFRRRIGIYQKEDGVPYDFVVINEMTGKEYHANRDDSGEADQANE